MNTDRIQVQLTKTQFIDGRLHTVDPKGEPVLISLLAQHAKMLIANKWAVQVDPPPASAKPAPAQVGEPANN
jgi:hypothetical protein